MAEQIFGFNEKNTQRVVDATRHYERSTGDRPRSAPPSPSLDVVSFWVELTAAGNTSGFYNWKMVYYNPLTNAWDAVTPAVTGTNNAREANLTAGLYNASALKRYKVDFAGFNNSGVPIYLFAAGGALPAGLGKGKVLKQIDDIGTWGVDYPTFAATPAP